LKKAEAVNVGVDVIKVELKTGIWNFLSCEWGPKIINYSVLEVFRHRRFEVIQEICITAWR